MSTIILKSLFYNKSNCAKKYSLALDIYYM